MIGQISHRGPDGSGVEGQADHVFGHARLAIIDVAGGRQPMISASGRWLVAYNGEIYNYRELRALIGDSYPFTTQSDTEVLLAAVERFGLERGLSLLDGMYAIALFDRIERRLHLVRDHFGIKPLYYSALADGGYAFASELKAFRPLDVPMVVDPVSVVTQLLCRFIPAPFTGHAGIRKLRPGEWLAFAPDGRQPPNSCRIVPVARAAVATRLDGATTESLLDVAVRRQTVSDVPLGVLLSAEWTRRWSRSSPLP